MINHLNVALVVNVIIVLSIALVVNVIIVLSINQESLINDLG